MLATDGAEMYSERDRKLHSWPVCSRCVNARTKSRESNTNVWTDYETLDLRRAICLSDLPRPRTTSGSRRRIRSVSSVVRANFAASASTVRHAHLPSARAS
jgi:hypothetical protein